MSVNWTSEAKTAWSGLQATALEHARDKTTVTASALATAALDFAATQAPQAPSRPAAPATTSGLVFPNYGRSKGLPVKGASRGDLEFYAQGCQRTLSDPSKERWHDKERALLAAIEAELGM